MPIRGFSDDEVQRMAKESDGDLHKYQVEILLKLRELPRGKYFEGTTELAKSLGRVGEDGQYTRTWHERFKDLRKQKLIDTIKGGGPKPDRHWIRNAGRELIEEVARKACVALGMARVGPEEADEDSDEPEYVPHDRDEREFVYRQIPERPGQGRFRDALRKRYGDRCMVTGCEILEVLEAAHINPYRGENDNDPTNGLLLRADIHTLFDLNLLGIHPETLKVEVSSVLSTDSEYGELAGKPLKCSIRQKPSPSALKMRYKDFRRSCESSQSRNGD